MLICRSLEYVKGLWLHLLASNVLMIAGSVLTLSIPTMIGTLFDHQDRYLQVIGLLLGMLLAGALAESMKTRLLAKISNRIAVRLRMGLMQKLLRLPQDYFAHHSSGEIISIIGNDVNQFRDALSGGLVYVLEMVLSLVVVTVLMFRIEPIMTLVLLGSMLLILGANTLLTRGVTPIASQTQAKLSDIHSLTTQGISGMQVLHTFRLHKLALQMLLNANLQWEKLTLCLARIRSRTGFVVKGLSALQLAALIYIGMRAVQAGTLQLGELTAFILYAQGIASPLTAVSSLFVDIKTALASMRRVYAVLDEREDIQGQQMLMAPLTGHIHMRDVSFSYSANNGDRTPVLSHISFDIPQGSMAALVGESGSGKTTIMNLLAGFLKPDQGEIYIDGIPIFTLSMDSLHANLSMVSQNPYLFQISVRDNIACGKSDASLEEIVEAARLAHAHEFIQNLPQGYQTILGENGINLSGGQRQRIALARAFLKNAPILLLDEATSALDNHSEWKVQNAITCLMRGKTTFVIAHRLSTIQNADCIFYLKNGEIIASGTHTSMMKHSEEYQYLFNESQKHVIEGLDETIKFD